MWPLLISEFLFLIPQRCTLLGRGMEFTFHVTATLRKKLRKRYFPSQEQ
jgi:hypothetical protein